MDPAEAEALREEAREAVRESFRRFTGETLFDHFPRKPAIGVVHDYEDKDGLLIRADMIDPIADQWFRVSPLVGLSIGILGERVPPTRRQRLRWRWLRITGYFRHLGLAIVNQCDRESDWPDW